MYVQVCLEVQVKIKQQKEFWLIQVTCFISLNVLSNFALLLTAIFLYENFFSFRPVYLNAEESLRKAGEFQIVLERDFQVHEHHWN